MLHITKFYKPNCFGCQMLDNELELLQLDTHFTVPFLLHHVNIQDNNDTIPIDNLYAQNTHERITTDRYKIKKVPLLIFEEIPDNITRENKNPIPRESTLIGALTGFHRKDAIIAYISEILALTDMKSDAIKEKLAKFTTPVPEKK